MRQVLKKNGFGILEVVLYGGWSGPMGHLKEFLNPSWVCKSNYVIPTLKSKFSRLFHLFLLLTFVVHSSNLAYATVLLSVTTITQGAAKEIQQGLDAWNMVGKGQGLAYNSEQAAKVEAMRNGQVTDATTYQEWSNGTNLLLGSAASVSVTEGTDAYGAANPNNGTVYVGMDGDRTGSLVNTLASKDAMQGFCRFIDC